MGGEETDFFTPRRRASSLELPSAGAPWPALPGCRALSYPLPFRPPATSPSPVLTASAVMSSDFPGAAGHWPAPLQPVHPPQLLWALPSPDGSRPAWTRQGVAPHPPQDLGH